MDGSIFCADKKNIVIIIKTEIKKTPIKNLAMKADEKQNFTLRKERKKKNYIILWAFISF